MVTSWVKSCLPDNGIQLHSYMSLVLPGFIRG
jgi:hypothetical protein